MALGSILSIVLHFLVIVVAIFGLPYYVKEALIKSPPLSVNLVASDNPNFASPLPPELAPPPAAVTPPLDPLVKTDKTRSVPKEPQPKPQSRKEFLRSMKENLPADSKKSAAGFSKFVKSLDKNNQPKPQPEPTASKKLDKPAAAVKGDSPSNGRTLNATQMEAVKRTVEPCWNIDSGARRDNSMQVAIRLTINREGVVQTTTIIDQARYRSDIGFRAAADAAKRAVENPRCRKLPLPLESYSEWREAVFIFDPSDN